MKARSGALIACVLLTNAIQAGGWWVALSHRQALDVAEWQRRVREAEQANVQLGGELARVREELARATVAATTQAEERQPQVVVALRERVAAFERTQALARREAKTARDAVQAKDRELRRLTAARDALEQTKTALNNKIQQLESTKAALSRQIQESKRQTDATERQVAAVHKDHQAVAKRFEQQLTEVKHDLAIAQADTKALAAQRQEVERLRQELAMANEQMADLVVSLELQEQLVAQSASRPSGVAPAGEGGES